MKNPPLMPVQKRLSQNFCFLLYGMESLDAFAKLKQQLQHLNPLDESSWNAYLNNPNRCSSGYCMIVSGNSYQLQLELEGSKKLTKGAKLFIVHLDAGFNRPNSFLKGIVEESVVLEADSLTSTALTRNVRKHLVQFRRQIKSALKLQIQKSREDSSLHKQLFIKQLFEQLEKHYSQKRLKTSCLAQQMGISQSTLERKCRRYTGKKPNQILLEFRLMAAYKLSTQTYMPFSKIALKCGFSSASYFSVRYTDFFKMTPSQSRLQGLKAS